MRAHKAIRTVADTEGHAKAEWLLLMMIAIPPASSQLLGALQGEKLGTCLSQPPSRPVSEAGFLIGTLHPQKCHWYLQRSYGSKRLAQSSMLYIRWHGIIPFFPGLKPQEAVSFQGSWQYLAVAHAHSSIIITFHIQLFLHEGERDRRRAYEYKLPNPKVKKQSFHYSDSLSCILPQVEG